MKTLFKDPTDPTNEELSAYLTKEIPKEQVERVFASDCDIDCMFVGFVKTYWHLSKIIPKDFCVYDFGAAYNFQSWFFRKHKAYIAIEPEAQSNTHAMVWPDNCSIFASDAKYFLDHYGAIHDKAFAIVNFVPNGYDQDVIRLVKAKFQNVYTFYPCNLVRYENDKTIH